ncbi:MAG: hypothetical protein GQ525_13765, partial [Draconibacterium sp.]|nr:hypothetical protein [Draconibacterium sp.]
MKRVVLLSILLISFYNFSFSKIRPTQLTCEYLENLSVVDVNQPRLAWINIAEEGERGQTQTAWQIRVASSNKLLNNPDLWDSKKVTKNQSIRVEYDGKKLVSRQECFWQVRVWDKNDEVSEWSEPAFWRMGLLNPSDWQATWIGVPWQGEEALPIHTGRNVHLTEQLPPPAPMFRKDFTVEKEIENAV